MSFDCHMKTPWLNSSGNLPTHLEYPDCSMAAMVERTAKEHPNLCAYVFFGRRTSYARLLEKIEECARALRANGISEGDKVSIALPNCPQGVTMFYAVNMIGAVANMIHPLSSEKEIEHFVSESESKLVVTLDQFYGKFENVRKEIALDKLLITSIKDEVGPVVRLGYNMTEGRKHEKIPPEADIILWNDFLESGRAYTGSYRDDADSHGTSVILYSGGTTGVSKGICLSSYNFNALAKQIVSVNPGYNPGDKMLAVMPIFHGFGLGISIHTSLCQGGNCILVPRFTPDSYVKLMLKYRCNYIAGVPALFEALIRMPKMKKADLSFLKGVFSGGDSLSVELKRKMDRYLDEHNSPVQVREGYGTTECVTASCLTPAHRFKEGSIGIPLPDMYYKIVKPGTCDELEYGATGEICVAGPTVMLGYNGHEEENANTLKQHPDGMKWVHTGDLGVMDKDGFVYFKQRLKRMIITNGYNVYPSQLENVFDSHDKVHMSCVIGVPDPIRQQRVKVFVMLKKGIEPSKELEAELMEHARKNIAKYALPKEIEFRDSFPQTLVGKVAYRVLEEEEIRKNAQNEAIEGDAAQCGTASSCVHGCTAKSRHS